jgi:hypothetical protein
MEGYRKRLGEVAHGKPVSRVYALTDASLVGDIASAASRIEELKRHLTLAANRIDRLALEMGFGSLLRDEALDWSTAARSALSDKG